MIRFTCRVLAMRLTCTQTSTRKRETATLPRARIDVRRSVTPMQYAHRTSHNILLGFHFACSWLDRSIGICQIRAVQITIVTLTWQLLMHFN
jgi:sterol desaturase/sphingolipid hydroxylase (fatty acid hydroxylase superfamily)